MTLRIGGLFEGYGGLTMAVRAALGGELAWYSEIEPAACKVLAHHHPEVPNLGDVTAVDWDSAEPVDVLTGGFPCQDVSAAGRRAGIRPGTRSGLWAHMAYAIDRLRPQLVVIENVRGLLSADAACDLEPCPWCVGDGGGRPLRALGAVLGDLADGGFDARWGGLRAADVGAPHGRYRLFITAWPAADPRGGELQRRRVGGVLAGAEGAGAGEGPQRQRDRHPAGDGGAAPQDPDRAARHERRPAAPRQAQGRRPRADARGSGDAPAANTSGTGLEGPLGAVAAPVGQREAPQPRRGPAAERHRAAAADAVRDGREGRPQRHLGAETGEHAPLGTDAARRVLDWGAYAPAIRRWELILGRPAPAPTTVGRRGGQQLNPVFVEWLMGLPAGHVTAVPGVSRNEQLKMLGNGVVPQQAAAALRSLLVAAEPQGRALEGGVA